MAYMVLPSEATTMALTSHGERRSFLLAILPGVSMIAQLSTALSGGLANASAAEGTRLAIGKTAKTNMQKNM